MEGRRQDETRTMRGVQVKNRAPAPIQITAEQLMVEARDRALADAENAPVVRRQIVDEQEAREQALRTRKEFEDRLRMNRTNIGVWIRYAKWEQDQGEIERARSIYERALDIDYKQATIWIRYAEMELKSEFVNRARNVWDRAISVLPRVTSLWYKYTYMEEALGNINNSRLLFDRWMEWEPEEQAWLSYIKFEQRCGEVVRARGVFERLLLCHPSAANYLRYAKWEDKGNSQKALARRIYERALDELSQEDVTGELYLSFAQFEEKCGEIDRARTIYSFGLEMLPEGEKEKLRESFSAFERVQGDKSTIESFVTTKRRDAYEQAVQEDPYNYDAWFDYIRLESEMEKYKREELQRFSVSYTPGSELSKKLTETQFQNQLTQKRKDLEEAQDKVRDLYERAVAAIPPIAEKKYWSRYIYLWIKYALFEELDTQDYERVTEIYKTILRLIPHKSFTFARIWILNAKFHLRRLNLAEARKTLGMNLGVKPEQEVIEYYVNLELQLGEVDRMRKIFEKALTIFPSSSVLWIKYARIEEELGEIERAYALYEIAITMEDMDGLEAVWKAYIDAAINSGELELARSLYRRLLKITSHPRVFISFAEFENTVAGDVSASRAIFNEAYEAAIEAGEDGREMRVLIAEAWYNFEQERVNEEDEYTQGTNEPFLRIAESKLPIERIEKVRYLYKGGARVPPPPMLQPDGTYKKWEPEGEEAYIEYVFPEEKKKQPGLLTLLQKAKMWKATAQTGEGVAPDASEIDLGESTAGLGFSTAFTGDAATNDENGSGPVVGSKRPYEVVDASEIDI